MNDASTVAPKATASVRSIVFGVALLALTFVVAPRSSPFLLIVWAAAAAVNVWRQGGRFDIASGFDSLFALLCGFILYLYVNATWSAAPWVAFGKVNVLMLSIVAILVWLVGTKAAGEKAVTGTAKGLALGLVVGIVYLGFELATDLWIERSIFSLAPNLKPGVSKHFIVEDGRVIFMAAYKLNRSAAALSLLLWPGLAIVWSWPGLERRRAIAVAALVLAFVGVMASWHESSKLALIIGLAVLVLAWHWPRLAGWLVVAGWCVAVLAVRSV